MNNKEKNNHSIKHMIMMVFACGGAFLLILVLPLFGVSRSWSNGIAIGTMIGLHLLMMKGHSDYDNHKEYKEGAK